MLALILVLVVGTIRLVGTNANNAFSLCGQLNSVSNGQNGVNARNRKAYNFLLVALFGFEAYYGRRCEGGGAL